MDPICHTLVGATLSRAGLERLTRRATGTLILAANAPDVDIMAAFLGRNLEVRRGITHGIPALLLWPFVLAAVVWAWDRWRRRPGEAPVHGGGLIAISAIGVVSHPVLDYLNSYGMRWLMPLRDQWFYGDSVFIVDPWLYLVLGGGLWLGRRARRGGGDVARPVRRALAVAGVYVAFLVGTTLLARRMVAAAWGEPVPRFMASAVPVNPFRKQLIVSDGDTYHVGSVRVGPGGGVNRGRTVARGARWEEARAALARTRDGRAYLSWARFPVVAADGGPDAVTVYDLRYSNSADTWASITVPLARHEQP